MDEEQMKSRCPKSSLVGTARLDNHRLDFTHFSQTRQCGVPDIVPSPGDFIWGLVYRVTLEDIKGLDQIEGRGRSYERGYYTVRFLDGRKIGAHAYYVIQRQSYVPPNAEYLRLMRQAVIKHSFPEEYVKLVESFVPQG